MVFYVIARVHNKRRESISYELLVIGIHSNIAWEHTIITEWTNQVQTTLTAIPSFYSLVCPKLERWTAKCNLETTIAKIRKEHWHKGSRNMHMFTGHIN